MPYFVRIPGNCVRRIPMKPVSRMTSRISVNGTGGNEFHKFEPNAHRTFLLAGSRDAAMAREPARPASRVRRVIIAGIVALCRMENLFNGPITNRPLEFGHFDQRMFLTF